MVWSSSADSNIHGANAAHVPGASCEAPPAVPPVTCPRRAGEGGGGDALEGEVGCASQREAAAQAIAHLPGVIGVANRIRVTAPRIDETELRVAIVAALERQIDREAQRIQIHSAGGTIH